ncbi:unnamed protein product [Linum tenue]|uniref:Uncharacterized protein n=1 Tax=Linum tenue TaxID=586396 RepID=A0AAV0RSB6_9ROSI|nr:unnamed protein product [Linum tenue]
MALPVEPQAACHTRVNNLYEPESVQFLMVVLWLAPEFHS